MMVVAVVVVVEWEMSTKSQEERVWYRLTFKIV